jgi:hypothetical protein
VKRILIISFSEIHRDPRVMRQISLLESVYDLTITGFGKKPEVRLDFIEIKRQLVRASIYRKVLWVFKLVLGCWESYYWNQNEQKEALRLLQDVSFDILIANDIQALPLALKLANGKPVIFDAHEYSPKENEENLIWRLLFGRYNHALCRKYLPLVQSMLTVCQGIADEYNLTFGVKPLVVHNAPQKMELLPSVVNQNLVRMIHHGVAIRSRRLELMIDVMKHLDSRFTLDFMLNGGDASYITYLQNKAQDNPRIRFIEPVSMSGICSFINQYDVGIYILPPDNFNHKLALPNKLFEFIQARLAIAIGPSPEMARLIKGYGCGIVSDSFEPEALACILKKITIKELKDFKYLAHLAAEELCFEFEGPIILSEVRRLVGK